MKYDVVIIGGGSAGCACAVRCAQYGLTAAVVEKELIGGTCVNRGCIPAKTLLFAAGLLSLLKKGKRYGVAAKGVAPDFEALRARCAEVTIQLRGQMQKMLKQNQVDVYYGAGRIAEEGKVHVSGAAGDTFLEARDIVIAAGSSPLMPYIPGSRAAGVYTTDTILSDLPDVKSLIVIGGSGMGAEFAEIYQALGAKVTVVEEKARLLPDMDTDMGRHLAADFRKKGIAVHTKTTVTQIERCGRDLAVVCGDGEDSGEKTLTAEAVLVAAGRRSRMEGLSDVPVGEAGGLVTIDEKCRTTVPHIYAIGDITSGRLQMAHAAEAQGKIAAAAIAGKPCDIRMDLIPQVVYTKPEMAAVGLMPEEARKKGIPVKSTRLQLGSRPRSLIGGEGGFIKIITGRDGKILGAAFHCDGAGSLISEATLAIAGGMTAETFASIVRPHPSVEEAVGEIAENVALSAG